MKLKIHKGAACERCRRQDIKDPTRRHRSYSGGKGQWCRGLPLTSKERQARALERESLKLLRIVRNMAFEGKHEQLVAALRPLRRRGLIG